LAGIEPTKPENNMNVVSIKNICALLAAAVAAFFSSIASAQSTPEAKPSASEIESLVKAAYVWGYPLIVTERTRLAALYRTTPTRQAIAPNQFRNTRRLLTHNDRAVVMPNNDTLYASAWLSLADGPTMLETPEHDKRYVSFQLLDAFTNTLAYLGPTRGEVKPRKTWIVGPTWRGAAPAGVEVVRVPTNTAWLLGRSLVSGAQDVAPAAAALDRSTLTPIGSPRSYPTPPTSFPSPQMPASNGLAALDEIVALLDLNPPFSQDDELMRRLAILDFRAGGRPVEKIAGWGLTDIATAALLRADEEINQAAKKAEANALGWVYEEVGNAGRDYFLRAKTARSGYGALTSEEAYYFTKTRNASGEKLNGARLITLEFDPKKLPAYDGFWSLSMYDGRDFFFIENPIKRYAIGDRTEGLSINPNGKIRIAIAFERPNDPKVNWLPAPNGDYLLTFRVYRPRASAKAFLEALPNAVNASN
jgi:hypothetical protein